jgi:hypothetical protein
MGPDRCQTKISKKKMEVRLLEIQWRPKTIKKNLRENDFNVT